MTPNNAIIKPIIKNFTGTNAKYFFKFTSLLLIFKILIKNGSIIAVIAKKKNNKTDAVKYAQACSSVIRGKKLNFPCIMREKNM